MIFATFRFVTILFFRSLGRVAFCLSKKRKPIALKNIELCFPIKNKIDLKRNKNILKRCYVGLAHSVADFFLLPFYNKKNIDKYVRVKNWNYLEQALQKGKGVIFSTGHFGSWELAAHFMALKGLKCLVLYNPIKRPLWLEKFVKNNRQISGNILIPKQKSLLSIFRKLKENGLVTFITDQNCLPVDGVKVPLFGHNVWTHSAFIKLSLKTGAPIVPAFIFTKGLFKYEIEFFKPMCPEDFSKEKMVETKIAASSNKILEAAINKKPDHWMWQHRRFKNLDN